MSYGCVQRVQKDTGSACACMCVCRGIKGGERVKKKDKEEEKNERFVSFYPCLDVLAGTFEGSILAGAHQKKKKDLGYSGVYVTDCCMAAGDSLLLLKLLWPKYCYTLSDIHTAGVPLCFTVHLPLGVIVHGR